MTKFICIFMFLWPMMVTAVECGEVGAKHWNTVLNLKPAPVTLHWTGVYEGLDSVCGVAYEASSGESRTLEVWGQPEVNETENLLAFLACADDGCDKDILVADVARGVVLKAELPISGAQSYLKAKWKGVGRELIVEVESPSGGQESSASQFVCSVTETINCTKSGI